MSSLRNFLALIPHEWKQRITLLFAFGLALVPVIYSGNMVWAFDDPSGHLSRITAAVVDEDRGADVTGPDGKTTHVTVGADFTRTLLDTDKRTVYTFVRTDAATARKGLADGTYGATVEIPSDFSSDIASMGGKDPAKAVPGLLTIRTNDSINYVSGNFTKAIGTALTDALRKSVLEKYLDNVYVGMSDIHANLNEAADGAGRLRDGAAQLHDGTGQLANGSGALADGAGTLRDGAGRLVIGLRQLDAGADRLASANAQIAAGAGTLSSGLSTLDANSPQLRGGAGTLADGATQARDGAQKLSDGTSQVASGTAQLDQKVRAAQKRAADLGIDKESVQRASDQASAALAALADIEKRFRTNIDSESRAADTAAALASANAKAVDAVARDARAIADAAGTSTADAGTVANGSRTIADAVARTDKAVQAAADGASARADAAAAHSTATGDYTGAVDALARDCAASGASADFCARLQKTSDTSGGLRDGAASVADATRKQSDAVAKAASASSDVSATATKVADAADRIRASLGVTTSTTSLASRADALATAAERAQGPAHRIADSTASIASNLRDLRKDVGPDGSITDPTTPAGKAQKRLEDLTRQAQTLAAELPRTYADLQTAADGVHRLNAGAQKTASGAQQLADANARIANGANALSGGIDRYTAGVGQASQGASKLSGGAAQAADGAGALAGAAGTAANGAGRLRDGAGKLADGAARLHDGAEQAEKGAGQLTDGSGWLATALSDGAGKVPSYSTSERKHLSGAAAQPVTMSFVRNNGLDRFGEGLAPLFLGISLWVGGMATFLMMPPFSRRAAERGAGPLRLLAGGLLPALGLGVVQTAIAVGVLHLAIGITVRDLPLLLGMATLTSLVFVGLNHAFGALFGPVGKFVALVLIALQISGAGGTYPTQTLPGFFRAIHGALPMTHAVNAFRGAIGGGWVDPTGDVTWLLGWGVLALVIGYLGAVKVRRQVSGELDAA